MANEFLTLMDLKNRMEIGDGAIAGIAEVIAQENEILADVPWTRGNLVTGDRHLVRAAMPKVTRRKINEGVKASTSKTESHTETCIELVSRGVVDMKELKLAPDPAKFLLSENKPHIAMLGEELAAALFYDRDADGIVGFASRYGKLSSSQVVDAGGTTGTLGSIYFIKWDSDEVTGIYPKNTSAGLEVQAHENELVPDKNGDLFRAHVSDFSWFVGLKVRDGRYASRVCNVPMTDLATDATLRQKLFELMITAKNKIHHVTQGRVVCYVSPDLFSWLEIAAFQKANLALGYKDMTSDTRILTFSGIPIRRNDCQTGTETKVV
jgi:hypothetical protein